MTSRSARPRSAQTADGNPVGLGNWEVGRSSRGESGRACSGRGTSTRPLCSTRVPLDARLLREEIFGPVAPVASFASEEEAVRAANDTEYGLAAFVYTRDLDRAIRVVEGLETGMAGLNQGTVSNPDGAVRGSEGVGRRARRWPRRDRRVPRDQVRSAGCPLKSGARSFWSAGRLGRAQHALSHVERGNMDGRLRADAAEAEMVPLPHRVLPRGREDGSGWSSRARGRENGGGVAHLVAQTYLCDKGHEARSARLQGTSRWAVKGSDLRPWVKRLLTGLPDCAVWCRCVRSERLPEPSAALHVMSRAVA